MEKNQILIVNGTDYRQMTKDLLEECCLEKLIGDRKKQIGIKPNLVSGSPASNGATTHTEVVAGILEYLKEHDFQKICVLESSWVGDRTEEVARICGYDRLCREYQVPFYDMQKEKGVMTDCSGMELSICRKVRDIDFLINVPVLKGHCQTKITCALKNMKGLIPNKEKRRFHSMGLHKPIAHLNTAIRQDFIVVDNICGDLDFEDGGHPVVMNRVLAARDPVLTDAYVCQLMHYDVSEVPYITLAEKLGVGNADIRTADIRTVGEASAAELPRSRKVVEVRDKVEEVESCSACYGYLIPALSMLHEEGLLSSLKEKVCIGQGYRGKGGKLGIGHCTSGFECHLEGCPPTENQIYDFLKNYISSKR